jgi:hypothetical protein
MEQLWNQQLFLGGIPTLTAINAIDIGMVKIGR